MKVVKITDPLCVGRIIRDSRMSKRIQAKDLAEMAGTTAVTINNIEFGKHKPRLKTVMALLDVLGYEIAVRKKDGEKLHRPKAKNGIGDVLNLCRRRNDLSCRRLEFRTGVSRQTIMSIEDMSRDPYLSTCITLFNALGYELLVVTKEVS